MNQDDFDPAVRQLQKWYRSGIFEINVSEIAITARKKIKGTLKTDKKVDDFLLEVTETLSPLNQPIPAVGKGIAKIFDACPAPGYAFALQRFVNENTDNRAWELIKKYRGRLLQLAVLALSKPGDNLIAILHVLYTKDKIEVQVRSNTNASIAKKPRGELSPIKALIRQHIRSGEQKMTQEIYDEIVTNQSIDFAYRYDQSAGIKIYETEETSDGRKKIAWELSTVDKYGNEKTSRSKNPITFKTFDNYCSEVRGKI